MYIDYYTALKTSINTLLTSIKTVDWYNGQYNRYEDLKQVAFPAVYIEFMNPLRWVTDGNRLQHAAASIKLHLVVRDIKDGPEISLAIAKELFKTVHGLVLVDVDDRQLSTELVRTESDLNTNYDQLKVIEMVFETTLWDYSAVKEMTEVSVGLVTSEPIE